MALHKEEERQWLLGAVGIRSDGAIVYAQNGNVAIPTRSAHAEYRLGKKLDKGSMVYVSRIRRDTNQFGLAKPCANCEKFLRSKGVKKVYYTISENEYGVMNFG